MGRYDTALVCLNGHAVNEAMIDWPDGNSKFCPTCGATTVSSCALCNTPIRGVYHHDGAVIDVSPFRPAAFCHGCGKPYPWTEAALEAARALAQESEGLSPEDRGILTAALGDLVIDSPKTTLAVTRFKRIVARSGKETADAFRSILTGIVTEAVKKAIWPHP